jgi:hypothetical protein
MGGTCRNAEGAGASGRKYMTGSRCTASTRRSWQSGGRCLRAQRARARPQGERGRVRRVRLLCRMQPAVSCSDLCRVRCCRDVRQGGRHRSGVQAGMMAGPARALASTHGVCRPVRRARLASPASSRRSASAAAASQQWMPTFAAVSRRCRLSKCSPLGSATCRRRARAPRGPGATHQRQLVDV